MCRRCLRGSPNSKGREHDGVIFSGISIILFNCVRTNPARGQGGEVIIHSQKCSIKIWLRTEKVLSRSFEDQGGHRIGEVEQHKIAVVDEGQRTKIPVTFQVGLG
ncbi:hypothetical protein B0J17DRAFT_629385 [Rhizoctonia solani]|nr:hypothetical protein B0J17DRAFT_629385 [Rhizoctonia solani]